MNKKYVKFKKSAKKVALAKDILSQLPYLNFGTGVYIDEKYTAAASVLGDEFLFSPEILSKCKMCAKGAMFISYIKKFAPKTLISDLDTNSSPSSLCDDIDDALSNIFDQTEIDWIECIFESDKYMMYNNDVLHDESMPMDDIIDAWHSKYKDLRSLVKAMMLNIVRNGYFNPLEIQAGKLIKLEKNNA